MVGACRATVSLFALATLAGWCEQLPLRHASIQAAWCLGVLDTMDDKAGLLRELHRVLVPEGALGLLVLLQQSAELPEQPAGNRCPSEADLAALLESAGFVELEHVGAGRITMAPLAWQIRADRVEEVLALRHSRDPVWQQAAAQQRVMERLLGDGHVTVRLVEAQAWCPPAAGPRDGLKRKQVAG